MKRLGWRNIVFWIQESDYGSGYEEILKADQSRAEWVRFQMFSA